MQRVASGDSASRQAVTCSERRAGLETRNVGADPPQNRGRPPSLGNRESTPGSDMNPWSHRGSGDGMSAEEIRRNTGSPGGAG